MWADALNVLIGLALGLATGFFFERRSLSEARNHALELEKELHILREGIYSVGGNVKRHEEKSDPSTLSTDKLAQLVHRWAADHQDSRGRVNRSRIVGNFISQGHTGREIETALKTLSENARVTILGNWIEVR